MKDDNSMLLHRSDEEVGFVSAKQFLAYQVRTNRVSESTLQFTHGWKYSHIVVESTGIELL
jgi:hypothetical protein